MLGQLLLLVVIQPYIVSSYSSRVLFLVKGMSLEEKVGQMTQLNVNMLTGPDRLTIDETKLQDLTKRSVGSYLNSPFSDGPINKKYGWSVHEWRAHITRIQEAQEQAKLPILYGLDSVHGANFVSGAVLFPHQINAGASFNPPLVYEMGRITGKDSLAAGIPWIFSPVLDVALSSKWPRVFETFGEDPYVVTRMGRAMVQGIESNGNISSCMKHFLAYGKSRTGHDRDNVEISDFDLLNYIVPSFRAGMEVGSQTLMEGYNSINGLPIVSSKKILQDLVRDDLHFEGVIVTDWMEIDNLVHFHHTATNSSQAIEQTFLRTSVDISMVPTHTRFIDDLIHLVHQGIIPESRIDESVLRIVQLKENLGLLDTPVPGAEFISSVGSDQDVQAALHLARESIVLLKNQDQILPMAANQRIFLTGPIADSVGLLCGGWSVAWQGVDVNAAFKHGRSIYQSLVDLYGPIPYLSGVSVHGQVQPHYMQALVEATEADVTIVVVGEAPYAEKPGDIDDLSLHQGQIQYVSDLLATGTRIVLVVVAGRPRLLQGLVEKVHAVLFAGLPCELGGQAVAEILLGHVNPSARLPLTYPKQAGNIDIPYFHRVSTRCGNHESCAMEWSFGSGMSYTVFEYSPLTLNVTETNAQKGHIDLSFAVRNVGSRAGSETILVFLSQSTRHASVPEVKMLKSFTKIHLVPQEAQHVHFTLTPADWSYYLPQIGQGFRRVVEPGEYFVSIGATSLACTRETIGPTCQTFSLV